MLSDTNGQIALAVLSDNSPSQGSLGAGASAEDIARAYGAEQGYRLALRMLQLLAEPLADTDLGEPTYQED